MTRGIAGTRIGRARIAGTWVAIASLALAGCTFVKSETEAEGVRVAEESEVASCRRVGTTTATVMSRIIGIGRSEKKMAGELATLARNQAAKKGADTVVATSPIESGTREFALYDCSSS